LFIFYYFPLNLPPSPKERRDFPSFVKRGQGRFQIPLHPPFSKGEFCGKEFPLTLPLSPVGRGKAINQSLAQRGKR